jgi:hypothetical protein
VGALGGTTAAPSVRAPFFVYSPQRRPDLAKKLASEGWVVVDEIPGRPTFGRAVAARLLALVPSQQERAARILNPPGLVVLKNPRQAGPT